MAHTQFGRVITAMVTPFNEQLKIDEQETASLVEHLRATGSDGVVAAGTTGESSTLSVDEKIRLYYIVREAAGKDLSVIAGTGTNCTESSIALTKAAEKSGADGVLAVAPYYNKPSQEGLYQHFKAIAESTSLPVILYNVPGRTVTNIAPETVARLAKSASNIVAIKEASSNLAQISEIALLTEGRLAIYSGDDFVTLPMLAIGGCGVISVTSHIIGKQIALMHNAFFAGNLALAKELHLKSISITKALFCTTSPAPVKYALAKLGIISRPSLRLPLVEPSDFEKQSIIDPALASIDS